MSDLKNQIFVNFVLQYQILAFFSFNLTLFFDLTEGLQQHYKGLYNNRDSVLKDVMTLIETTVLF